MPRNFRSTTQSNNAQSIETTQNAKVKGKQNIKAKLVTNSVLGITNKRLKEWKDTYSYDKNS